MCVGVCVWGGGGGGGGLGIMLCIFQKKIDRTLIDKSIHNIIVCIDSL